MTSQDAIGYAFALLMCVSGIGVLVMILGTVWSMYREEKEDCK